MEPTSIVGVAAWSLAALLIIPQQPVMDITNVNHTNGVITVGHGASLGGSIVLVAENPLPGDPNAPTDPAQIPDWLTNSRNLINSFDSGRQLQCAVWGLPASGMGQGGWNPTMAGNGPVANTPITLRQGPGWIHSRAIPVLWSWGTNDPNVLEPVPTETMYLWSEFLGTAPAFTVKSVFRGSNACHQYPNGQEVIPTIYVNRDPYLPPGPSFTFSQFMAYTGDQPWQSQPLSTSVFQPATSMPAVEGHLLTECWSALTDSTGRGISMFSNSSNGLALNYDNPNPTSFLTPRQNPTRKMSHVEFFQLETGSVEQMREGRATYYIGTADQARAFFDSMRPVPAGPFDDQFDAAFEARWDVNSRPTSIVPSGSNYLLRLEKPTVGNFSQADLSLSNRVWRNATFEVSMKAESPIVGGWWGFTIHKPGNQHFLSRNGGYRIMLQAGATGATLNIQELTLLGDGSATTIGSVSLSDLNPLEIHKITATFNTNAAPLIQGTIRYKSTLGTIKNVAFSASDSTPSWKEGYCSLVLFNTPAVQFDRFTVTPVAGETQDAVAPATPSALTASSNLDQDSIKLTWTNPADSDWLWTRIVRKSGMTAPAHIRDGLCIYEGKLSSYADPLLALNQPYTYAIFACDRAGNWSAPATVTASLAEQTFVASAQFSSTDWHANPSIPWIYRYFESGAMTLMTWSATHARWEKPGTNCMVKGALQHPGLPAESCRVWRAPAAGYARITGTCKKVNPNGDGVLATILRGAQVLWGPTLVTTTAGATHDVTIGVQAGDELIFRIHRNGNTNYDTADWDPTVTLTVVQ